MPHSPKETTGRMLALGWLAVAATLVSSFFLISVLISPLG